MELRAMTTSTNRLPNHSPTPTNGTERAAAPTPAQQLLVSPARLLLTAAEAAEALAISERNLWGLTDRGEIPVVRLGRCVRYDPADLRAFIEARKGH
jgi:excisionase family DNA binding protein